jgi:hypothetical protein
MDIIDDMRSVIPAIAGNQKGFVISGTKGLLVEVYRCPQCHFVELYEVNDE